MRELTSQLSIIIAVWSIWLFVLGFGPAWQLINDNIAIPLTMVLGSFVAGSTGIGGGAIAFPVLTKVLEVDSQTALLFSLAIQSIGMSCASILIFFSRIPINYRIIFASIVPGGLGMFCGLFYIRLLIASPDIKYLFSCFSFFVGICLIAYHIKNRKKTPLENHPKLIFICAASFLGGTLSGIIGTGIDFILFTLMLFFWGFEFKIATATSVVIMAINACLGFCMTLLAGDMFTGDVVNYWLSAIPIVAFGAPLGAVACKYLHRDIIFYLLLSLICIDVVSTITIFGIKLKFVLPLLLIFSAGLVLRKRRLSV